MWVGIHLAGPFRGYKGVFQCVLAVCRLCSFQLTRFRRRTSLRTANHNVRAMTGAGGNVEL